jgi:dTDP-glucose pyrophosphorylase
MNAALIPAAGRGMRMYPLTKEKPKAMLTIDGTPLLQYTLEMLRDHLQVKNVYVVIGEHGEQIQEYFNDGSDFNLDITYITQKKRKGIGHAIGLGEEYIDSPFFVILGDEMYIHTNHKEMLPLMKKDFSAICAVKKTVNTESIKKNYTAEVKGDKVLSLTEKPEKPVSDVLGVGTYAFDPVIFEYIKKTDPSPLRNEIEITDVINGMARAGLHVYAFFLTGYYQNINTIKDLRAATYQWRSTHFDQYTVSVIIPAYNEEASIGAVVTDFSGVDEVLVVDNNSDDNTAAIAEQGGAKVVVEPVQGYGNALKRGMDAASGDILIMTEADTSFKAKDLPKILEYVKDADMVVGTRTQRPFIGEGAHMDWFLQWGNCALGKMVEILWWHKKVRFSDVGCTYRGLWKDTYTHIRDKLECGGAAFSVEMMIEVMKADLKVVEIPVGYYARYTGESKHSAGRIQNMKTGLQMVSLILKKWLTD